MKRANFKTIYVTLICLIITLLCGCSLFVTDKDKFILDDKHENLLSQNRMIGWWANVSPKWISVSSQHLYILTLFIIDISNAISAASLTFSITGITPSAFTISLALLLRLTLSILKTLLRQPQDHQSYKYRFCRTRFVLTSLKRDTEKFKT